MLVTKEWEDYEIIDASRGQKYERWGNIYLLRPDPQVIWDNGDLFEKYHDKLNAVYYRSNKGGGHWENLKNTPASWNINYKNLIFNIKQMGFKHTGLFPEQAVNWDIMSEKIKNAGREIRVLNLFAYTGGATVACLKAGAHVTHVDSSRGMIDWCKENEIAEKINMAIENEFPDLPEEEVYFKRYEGLKFFVFKNFESMSVPFLEHVIDEIYDSLFED